ncbi:hypothetical protein D5E69_23030 (plasmid) [Rossellomorea marisflavi]|uniref:hypothetical protein n=1 Tax=Rossellomorea marisflavi TaxID=189381 RepID=UPI00131805CC|nr:hypothetical protein [Rossellomorea marisflavi]QHA38710.1 hypothetical protein D5E69_23030 [Rossellomorea marisflavi]
MKDMLDYSKLSNVQLDLFEDKPGYAALIMEEFIRLKHYLKLKTLKGNIDMIKKQFRYHLETSENKRHELEEHNLVCKFTTKKTGTTDYLSLNEFLYDHFGQLFVDMAEVKYEKIKDNNELLELVKPYQNPVSFFCAPAFNKAGKELIKPNLNKYTRLGMEELATSLNAVLPKAEMYDSQYEELKNEMMKCSIIQTLAIETDEKVKKDLKRLLKHKYGSVSLRFNKPTYDSEEIYKKLGADFLIQYSQPDAKLLKQNIMKGWIKEKDVEKFKTIHDIETEFTVMRLDVDRRIRTMYESQLIRYSLQRAN